MSGGPILQSDSVWSGFPKEVQVVFGDGFVDESREGELLRRMGKIDFSQPLINFDPIHGPFPEKHYVRKKHDLLRKRENDFLKSLAELYNIFIRFGNSTEDECARGAMETDAENMKVEFQKMAE